MSKVHSLNSLSEFSGGNVENEYASKDESKDNSTPPEKVGSLQHDLDKDLKKKSSFGAVVNTRIQLTWKNITIKAPPKKRLCKKVDLDQPDKIILGKKTHL